MIPKISANVAMIQKKNPKKSCCWHLDAPQYPCSLQCKWLKWLVCAGGTCGVQVSRNPGSYQEKGFPESSKNSLAELHSTVTLLARFRGWSMEHPLMSAIWYDLISWFRRIVM